MPYEMRTEYQARIFEIPALTHQCPPMTTTHLKRPPKLIELLFSNTTTQSHRSRVSAQNREDYERLP